MAIRVSGEEVIDRPAIRRFTPASRAGIRPPKSGKAGVARAGIIKRVGSHTFRHSFATHILENGVYIRVVQELMGHADVKATEVYTHVMEKDLSIISSPLDML